MKDFIDYLRQERRREKIRNRPADWKPPTWAEMQDAIRLADYAAFAIQPGKTWDYGALYKN